MPTRRVWIAVSTDPKARVGAVVQARMGSSRLPGKVMMPAAGRPLLQHLLDRLGRARTVDRIIVATTTAPGDDVIVELCSRLGIGTWRGSEADVLDRYHAAAHHFDFDVVVRVTADCPLIDPELVDEHVGFFLRNQDRFDLVTSRHPLTFPDGIDFDVMSRGALDAAWAGADQPHQREHVVPFFWESGMRVHNFEDPERRFWQHRWTLDYAEDYELIRRILEALDHSGQVFGTQDILDYLDHHPELRTINARYIPREPVRAGVAGAAVISTQGGS